jgi:two-component system, NtrC family, sensor kinase
MFFKQTFLSVACIVLLSISSKPQFSGKDSILRVLEQYRSKTNFEKDSNYISTLIELAFRYNNNNPDTTILLSRLAIGLCDRIDFKQGKSDALKNIGLAYNVKGDYTNALLFLAKGLETAIEGNYKKGAGRIYHNRGIVYSNLGKYPESLENYFQALKMREETRDTLGISSSTNGIGTIYFMQGRYADAMEKYKRALVLSQAINYIAGIESGYANIGEINYRQADYSEGIKNLQEALKLTVITGNIETKAFIYYILASIYLKQSDYAAATENFMITKNLAAEVGSPEYECRSRFGLSEVAIAQNDFSKALMRTKEGLAIVAKIGFNELMRDGNEQLSRIYEKQGNGMQALYHHRLFKLYADSINNQQTEQRSANLAADYEYAKKEIVIKAEQEKKQIEFQKKTNQQRWIIFSAFAALLVAWLIFRSRQKTKKANNLLHHQNIEIDKQKNIVEKALRDLKATQTQLIQSEKMASLGELTAGIAHEIQNPLNFVNNFSEVNKELLEEMKEEIDNGNTEEVKAIANDVIYNQEKITEHGKRADAIVKGMLQHSRSSSGIKEPTDINRLADEYLRLAHHGLRAKDKSINASIKTEFDETIGNINIIPQDIGRVILNLITNAFYVVNEKNKQNIAGYEPTVEVSTKKEGNKVLVSVKDNGNGIPQKIIDKIFQPFFTTKPTGQGTGLGLSLSYDIVKAHGGELKVETKDGEGSEFIISLPLHQ